MGFHIDLFHTYLYGFACMKVWVSSISYVLDVYDICGIADLENVPPPRNQSNIDYRVYAEYEEDESLYEEKQQQFVEGG